jgi:hypothetical protein
MEQAREALKKLNVFVSRQQRLPVVLAAAEAPLSLAIAQ